MNVAFAILSTIAGTGLSILFLILLIASSPNSRPDQVVAIKCWMGATALIAFLCFAGAVVCIALERPAIAAGIGGLPGAFVAAAFIVLWRTQS